MHTPVLEVTFGSAPAFRRTWNCSRKVRIIQFKIPIEISASVARSKALLPLFASTIFTSTLPLFTNMEVNVELQQYVK